MANSVSVAFNTFQKDTVNLATERAKSARASRDWLIEKIDGFTDFFPLYSVKHINFGSFARHTKIKPLDDIDIMVALMGSGCTYFEDAAGKVTLNVPDDCKEFKTYRHESANTLNSIKVVNEFVRNLLNIEQYKRAGIKRNQEAAVLNLKTYDWSFDIVPCFFTSEDALGRTYYIIPDGNGHWKKTDPRKDKERVTAINTSCDGNSLNVLRLIKYWQRRKTMPSMGSYLIECMVLDYYESKGSCSNYQDLELVGLFEHIASAVYGTVNDPKGIQGNLNYLTFDDRVKISHKANTDAAMAKEARAAEEDGDHEKSINKWRHVFGSAFPEYG